MRPKLLIARVQDPATNALILIHVIPKPFWPKKVTSTADLLFEEMNLIEANPSGGLTINTAKSPCKSPTKVCCQPIVASDPANRGTTSSPKPVVPSQQPDVNPNPENVEDTLND